MPDKPKITIITAVHNGLAYNKLFYEALEKYTFNSFELIIIDNASTDGSREYFESQKHTVVIKNEVNYSYPYCQNQGIAIAKADYLFFLNNDLIVSSAWDKKLISISQLHGLDIISAAGIENVGNRKDTQQLDRKWKRVKNPLSVFGFGRTNLLLMLKLMYGNWDRFCEKKYQKHGTRVVEGIVGNNVMMSRKALSALQGWDERIQAADWDIFITSKKRSKEVGDIKPCHIALGVFIHHFVRMTVKYAVKPQPFADKHRLIDLHEKWTEQEIDEMHPNNKTIRKF